MARIKVPYLTSRPRVNRAPLYYWQPSKTLRMQGFAIKRLSDDPHQAVIEAEAETARVKAAIAARSTSSERSPSARAATTKRAIAPDSVEAMVRAYKTGDDYRKLAAKTRREYDAGLEHLLTWAGDMPKRAVTPALAKQWYQSLKTRITFDEAGKRVVTQRPAVAAATIRVARVVWYWDRGSDKTTRTADEAIRNPFAMLRLDSRRQRELDPDVDLWSPAAIDAFIRKADELGLHSVGTAILLNTWIGQRMGDVLAIGRNLLDGDCLKIRQSKRGAVVQLPIAIVPHLAARIRDELGRLDARFREKKVQPVKLLVSEATDAAYSTDHFANKFEKIRTAVAVERPEWGKLQFAKFRHTAVVRLHEAGADELTVAAITGHKLETVHSIIERYHVKTRRMAEIGFRKRLDAEAAEASEAAAAGSAKGANAERGD